MPDTLFGMCARTACNGQDVILVDGANSFNPYAVSRAVKSMGFEPRQALSRIHVARAFTEYQMDAIISGLDEAVTRWRPSLVAVLYLSALFSTQDGKKLFGPIIKSLKEVTLHSGLVTVVTSFGGSWWGDRMVAGSADRIIGIEENKKYVRVRDGNDVFEHVTVPFGQMRFNDFQGGDGCGQDCSELPCAS